MPLPHPSTPPRRKSLLQALAAAAEGDADEPASRAAHLRRVDERRRAIYAEQQGGAPGIPRLVSAAEPAAHPSRVRQCLRDLRTQAMLSSTADEVEFEHAVLKLGPVSNWTRFRELGETIGSQVPFYSDMFTAEVFLKCPRNEQGDIETESLLQLARRHKYLLQGRSLVEKYDVECKGYLNDAQLDLFIEKYMTHWNVENLQTFRFTAKRKFKFMLDSKNRQRYDVEELVMSPEFNELRRAHEIECEELEPSAADVANANWFLTSSLQACNTEFWNLVGLDKHTGLLSKEELLQYKGGSYLTPLFVDCLFQAVKTYEGQLQYGDFLDLVIADSHRKRMESMMYFFSILDVHGAGYLDAKVINMFMRDVFRTAQDAELMTAAGPFVADKNMAGWINSEVFDMVRPEHPERITFRDLLLCKHGDVVLGIMTAPVLFIGYENREHMLAESRKGDAVQDAAEEEDEAAEDL